MRPSLKPFTKRLWGIEVAPASLTLGLAQWRASCHLLRSEGGVISRDAIIQKLNPYELHGVLYYQMLLSFDDTPDSLREVRLAHDAIYASPREGDRVAVETILSMVTGVQKKEA